MYKRQKRKDKKMGLYFKKNIVHYADIKPLETDEDRRNFFRSYKASMNELMDKNKAYYKYYSTMNKDIQTIALLKHNIGKNFFEIGKILRKYQEEGLKKDYKYFIAHPMVDIKMTQAKKMVAVYKYIAGEHSGQLTGIHIRLGIEKLYLISTVKNNEYYDDLENFALDKKITVKKLKLIVENIIQNPGITVEEAYKKFLQSIEDKKNNKLCQEEANQLEVSALQERIKQLETENLELKSKLEQFEKGVIDRNKPQEVIETSPNISIELQIPVQDNEKQEISTVDEDAVISEESLVPL